MPSAPASARGALARALAAALDAVGSDAFGTALLAFLGGEVRFDSALVLRYAPDRRPQTLAEAFAHPKRQNTLETYLAGAYLLDPFYARALAADHAEVVRLQDIVSEDFAASDYFRDYYAASRVRDELNILVPIVPGEALAVCIERAEVSPPFAADEIATLDAWCPLVASLAARHFASQSTSEQPDERHARMAGALERFGAQQLTVREQEVVRRILGGDSTPEIARRLSLSVETVRVHKRNAYRKLEVGSIAELFRLAFATITEPALLGGNGAAGC